jgi:hypothetical protein
VPGLSLELTALSSLTIKLVPAGMVTFVSSARLAETLASAMSAAARRCCMRLIFMAVVLRFEFILVFIYFAYVFSI